MITNLEKYKKDLEDLIALGDKMLLDLRLRAEEDKGGLNNEYQEKINKIPQAFEKNYQKWYTESFALIRQLVPERLGEFENLYKGESRRKVFNQMTYTIQDWLMGVRAIVENIITEEKAFNDLATATMRFQTQLEILKSVEARFESSLFDIKQLVQADLFDSELDAARELNKKGFVRGAGAVAGVVLESHLSQVCENHKTKVAKKNPSINDYNQLLKDNDVIETKDWRFIQHLADLRNLCDHKKKKEPTREDIEELINRVEKITKTIF